MARTAFRSGDAMLASKTSGGLKVLLVGFQDQDNLGLRYLISSVRAAGHDAEIATFQTDPVPLVLKALEINPDVIGLSLIFQYMTDAFAVVVAALRKAGVTAHIIIGGHYPSFSYAEVFAATPGLDSIARYEGEGTLVELLECLSSGRDWRGIKGLAYRDGNGNAVSNCLREPVADLDTLPWPERSDISYEASPMPTASILASRGCPWDCSFCSIRPFYEAQGGKLRRLRRPDIVVDEMEKLYRDRGVQIFLFQDDDYLATGRRAREWSEDVAREIVKRDLGSHIRLKISCRSDEIREEHLAKLMEGGLTHVYMGVESGDEDSLINMNKMLKPQAHLAAGQVLRSLGLSFDFGFMLMEPYSNFGSIRNNIDFLDRFVGDGYTVATFCRMLPYAGTPIKTRLESEGRLKGSATQPDYDFLDPRLDLFYAWMIEAFHKRNFSSEGLSQILRLLGFQARLVLDGVAQASTDERAYLRYLTAQANQTAFHIARQALDYLETLDLDELDGATEYLGFLAGMEHREEERMGRQAMDLYRQLSARRAAAPGGFDKSWTFTGSEYETRGLGAA
jgi:anaerobic magnesium-protoporphyrin IX monomethyl ester cyclase